MRVKLEQERIEAAEASKKAAAEAKLDARRAAIRERIARQHEIAAKAAVERVAAEEKARQELQRFRAGKPLYERVGCSADVIVPQLFSLAVTIVARILMCVCVCSTSILRLRFSMVSQYHMPTHTSIWLTYRQQQCRACVRVCAAGGGV